MCLLTIYFVANFAHEQKQEFIFSVISDVTDPFLYLILLCYRCTSWILANHRIISTKSSLGRIGQP